MLDMLAFSPHPDDVELCCGGLIAKMSQRGYRVGIVDLTHGEMGSEGTAEARLKEAAKAAKILGVKIRENMDLGDCRLNSHYDKAEGLAKVIRQYRPALIVAPYGDRQHPDHDASRRLVEKAVFFAKLAKMDPGLSPFTVKTITYYMLHQRFDPTFIVDVEETYDRKLRAIRAYKSQMNLMLGPNGLLRSIELRDESFGLKIGTGRGEPFFCGTPLKLDDPVGLLG